MRHSANATYDGTISTLNTAARPSWTECDPRGELDPEQDDRQRGQAAHDRLHDEDRDDRDCEPPYDCGVPVERLV